LAIAGSATETRVTISWIEVSQYLLGGISVLQGQTLVLPGSDCGKALYRAMSLEAPEAVDIHMVSYYAWGNRGRSEMTVWLLLR